MRKMIKNKKGKRSILMKNIGRGRAINYDYGTTIQELTSDIFASDILPDISTSDDVYLTTQVLAWGIEDNLKDNGTFGFRKYFFKSLVEVIDAIEDRIVSDWWILVKRRVGGGYAPMILGRGDPPFNTEVDDFYFVIIQGGGTYSEILEKNYIRAFYIKWGLEDFIRDYNLPDTGEVRKILKSWGSQVYGPYNVVYQNLW
jgi:hypothetical protein